MADASSCTATPGTARHSAVPQGHANPSASAQGPPRHPICFAPPRRRSSGPRPGYRLARRQAQLRDGRQDRLRVRPAEGARVRPTVRLRVRVSVIVRVRGYRLGKRASRLHVWILLVVASRLHVWILPPSAPKLLSVQSLSLSLFAPGTGRSAPGKGFPFSHLARVGRRSGQGQRPQW